MIIHHVVVCTTILDLHQIVVQNVPIIMIVPVIKHVYKKDVLTHAREHVVYLLAAVFIIIAPFVHVWMAMLEMHSLVVIPVQFNVNYLFCTEDFQINFPNILSLAPVVEDDPCNPSPCGNNARCSGAGICTCLPEYHGDPYVDCRPECVLNSDCPRSKACVRNKCTDPCIGMCGQNAICEVSNHIAMCICPSGMQGNAFVQCQPIQGIQIIDKNSRTMSIKCLFFFSTSNFEPM